MFREKMVLAGPAGLPERLQAQAGAGKPRRGRLGAIRQKFRRRCRQRLQKLFQKHAYLLRAIAIFGLGGDVLQTATCKKLCLPRRETTSRKTLAQPSRPIGFVGPVQKTGSGKIVDFVAEVRKFRFGF